MALPPKAAAASPASAAPDPTMDSGAGGDDGSDAGDGSDDSQDGPTVLLTVMDAHDGSFILLAGDENDGQDAGDGAADDAGADNDATGAAPGGDQSGSASQGQKFDSLGALLKGIMVLVQQSQDSSGTGAEASFQSGFSGAPAAGSSAPSAPQKY